VIFACVALLMPRGIVGSLLDLNDHFRGRAHAPSGAPDATS
jgi:hypothetical protein